MPEQFARGSSRTILVAEVEQILARHAIHRSVGADDELVDIGLTSIDMVHLMLAVEAEFDMTIPQPEITLQNFRSVASIETMIARLQGGVQTSAMAATSRP